MSKETIKCKGLLCLGDFSYAGQRIRIHCTDDEREYYVIRNTGKNIETYTFYHLSDACSEFNRGVNTIVRTNTTSDISVYMQHKAKYVKGSREKFARKNKQ